MVSSPPAPFSLTQLTMLIATSLNTTSNQFIRHPRWGMQSVTPKLFTVQSIEKWKEKGRDKREHPLTLPNQYQSPR